jgi:hypothetical protein
MFMPSKSSLALALAAVLSFAPCAFGQDPNFDDLADGANERDLVAAVRALSRRVTELEARLNAVDVRNQPSRSSSSSNAPKAPVTRNEQLERVVTDAKHYRDKVNAALDGHHFADPNDSRVVYWKIRKAGEWDVVTSDVKRFVSFMDAVLPRAGELTSASTAVYSELIRWGRGRIVYKASIVNPVQQDVLAVEYGAAVVPVPPPPSSGN